MMQDFFKVAFVDNDKQNAAIIATILGRSLPTGSSTLIHSLKNIKSDTALSRHQYLNERAGSVRYHGRTYLLIGDR